jgi:hypothetical protein
MYDVCAVLETYRYNLYGTIVSAPLFYGVTIDLSLIFRLYIFVPILSKQNYCMPLLY